VANAAFYYGPVWKEHKKTLNDLMTDSDNVLLLRPLSPERRIDILPAVDPITEANGAQGTVVAQYLRSKRTALKRLLKKLNRRLPAIEPQAREKPASWLRWT
jgi:hypothetical protein